MTEKEAIEILLEFYRSKGENKKLLYYHVNACPLCTLYFGDRGNCKDCPWIRYLNTDCDSYSVKHYKGQPSVTQLKYSSMRVLDSQVTNWQRWSIRRLEKWLKLIEEEEDKDAR